MAPCARWRPRGKERAVVLGVAGRGGARHAERARPLGAMVRDSAVLGVWGGQEIADLFVLLEVDIWQCECKVCIARVGHNADGVHCLL